MGRHRGFFTPVRNAKRLAASRETRKRQKLLGYRADEVAEVFGTTRSTVYRLAKDGVVPSLKLGARLRVFPRGAIRAMLKIGFQLKV